MVITKQQLFAYLSDSELEAIHCKKIFVDVTGELVAGVLLAKIVFYFHSHGKNGYNWLSLKQTTKGERLYLARRRTDWMGECRITERQYDRAIKLLQDLGLVTVELMHAAKTITPMPHIWLNTDTLAERVAMVEYDKDGLPTLHKASSPLYTNGKVHFTQNVKSYIEEKSIEKGLEKESGQSPNPAGKPKAKSGKPEPSLTGGLEVESENLYPDANLTTTNGVNVATAKETLAAFTAKKAVSSKELPPDAKLAHVCTRWMQQASKGGEVFVKALTITERSKLKHPVKALGAENTIRVIDWVWENPGKFRKALKAVGVEMGEDPTLGLVAAHYDVAWQLIAKSDAAQQQQAKKLTTVIDKPVKVQDTPINPEPKPDAAQQAADALAYLQQQLGLAAGKDD